MKKALLKSMLVAAALTMGMGAQAQKDVTSQYIVNAKLSDGLNGWTNVNFNDPVRGNKTAGYASESYAGWGSLEKEAYSLTQKVTLPAGHYTLVNYSFFRYGVSYNTDASKSLAFLKAGDQKVAVKTLGSITANGYANSQAEGANCFDSKMYRNTVDFTIDADNTEIEIGLEGTFDLKQSWVIAGMFELIDNDTKATIEGPFDMTGLITNPGFEYRDMTGWTMSADGAFKAQSNTSFDNKAGGFYCEQWQQSGALSDRSMKQTLTNIPNGLYNLSVYCYYGGTGAYVKANDNIKEIPANASGKYTVSTVVNNGEVTIEAGLKDGTSNWVCFDRFELNYCGDVEVYVNGLRDKVKAAIDDAAPMNGEVFAGLQKAYNDTEEINDYLAAIDQLNEALNKVEASVNAYAKAKEALDAMQRLMESTNVYTPAAYDTYNGIYTENLEKYEARTLTDAEALAIENPETVPGWHAATILDDFLLSAWDTNPDFADPAPYYINTWSVEGETDGSEFKVPFFEYWVSSGTLAAKKLTATLNDLPMGRYEVTALVRVQRSGDNAPQGITLQVNNGEAVSVCDGEQIGQSNLYLKEVTVEGIVGADKKMNIVFDVAEGNTVSWLSFKNVKYTALSIIDGDIVDVAEQLNKEIDHAVDVLAEPATAPVEAENALLDVIDEADTLYKKFKTDPTSVTIDEMLQMITKLQQAEEDFKAAVTEQPTTAISTISTSTEARQAYTLGGQQVRGQLSKGVYVVNGKKVVVK